MSDILDNATDFRCSKDDNVECFLLDKYGYIFCDSERTVYPENTFFGAVRGPIVKDLIDIGVLKPKYVLTPYGTCKNEDDNENEENEEKDNSGSNSGDNNDDGDDGESGGGSGECISIEHYYEFDEEAVGTEVNIGRTIVTNCMQGEYYVGAIKDTNLFFVMFQGPARECLAEQQVTPELEPIADYWTMVGSDPVERYGKACTEYAEHECVLSCPGNNDPIVERDVIVCGNNGDCFNGECICDPEYEIDDTLDCSLLSGSEKIYPQMTSFLIMSLLMLLLFCYGRQI